MMPPEKPGKPKRKLILVVDDDPDIISSLKLVLSELRPQYSVKGATGGSQCLSMLHQEKPDLVILDIMMPDLDGWDTAAQIKESNTTRDIPLLFLSALSDDETRTVAELTSKGFISKPFAPHDLVHRADKAMGISGG